ncbi:Cof subfamily protein (haloacid dehalogenase superfamily) [Enterococcus sp. PF1-24]|uniref:Cof-type HAD-IIB family hydrolase n=1 Tax=unclassified Enterococcus TaxID=2608891 RepID=UPI00247613C6|nr:MULTISPECIES: Cof-type HAD-IIB family hydrolase [unclassified Enterococcus]MDH6365719.1 Cof subfamily protein (haloacid dehalogenase superfamily) [Enterococcus sp. PFB1-1]MDH6402823.1 Cof subfamily protein (haloacid dehalogenase superfamily) [Enterococcus sp. PF1-24]
MIKAIFFDIDGTLVNNRSHAHPTTWEAIEAAQNKGVLCGVATGRSPAKIKHLTDHLPLDMYVTYNGQLVLVNQQIVYQKAFSPEVLAEIVDFADKNKREILFGGSDHLWGSRTVRWGNSTAAKRLAAFVPKNLPLQKIKNWLPKSKSSRQPHRYLNSGILEKTVYQCILLSNEKEQVILTAALPNCSFQRSNPYSVDITPKGGSKIKGIKAFAEKNKIELSEIMAFGDHYNDIEMLTQVGIGVAMGNAQAEVKAVADFVTHSNQEDGIAYALKHYQVI